MVESVSILSILLWLPKPLGSAFEREDSLRMLSTWWEDTRRSSSVAIRSALPGACPPVQATRLRQSPSLPAWSPPAAVVAAGQTCSTLRCPGDRRAQPEQGTAPQERRAQRRCRHSNPHSNLQSRCLYHSNSVFSLTVTTRVSHQKKASFQCSSQKERCITDEVFLSPTSEAAPLRNYQISFGKLWKGTGLSKRQQSMSARPTIAERPRQVTSFFDEARVQERC
jgi:hypothetical protein